MSILSKMLFLKFAQLLMRKQVTSKNTKIILKINWTNVRESYKKNDYGVRYRKGLVLLASFLNSNQDNKEYLKTLEEKHDIEHILPRQWCNYDQWTEELQKNNIDKLGNLILIEKKKNIQASNEFFQRNNKTIYKNSKVQDVKDLTIE